MNERIKFVIGQKKRYLNEISSRIANFKLQGKDLGVFVSIKPDGNLLTPRDFVDEQIQISKEDYAKLSKKQKKQIDDQYLSSTKCLIDSFNLANKKYAQIFDALSNAEKIEVLQTEINSLQVDYTRASAYQNTLAKQSQEKIQAKLGAEDNQLTEEQIVEVNQEVCQIKYIEAELKNKTLQLEKLKAQLS